MIYDKTCGNVRLTISDPSPSWVTITHDEVELRLMRLDELRDLRYLIDRGLEAASPRGRKGEGE